MGKPTSLWTPMGFVRHSSAAYASRPHYYPTDRNIHYRHLRDVFVHYQLSLSECECSSGDFGRLTTKVCHHRESDDKELDCPAKSQIGTTIHYLGLKQSQRGVDLIMVG